MVRRATWLALVLCGCVGEVDGAPLGGFGGATSAEMPAGSESSGGSDAGATSGSSTGLDPTPSSSSTGPAPEPTPPVVFDVPPPDAGSAAHACEQVDLLFVVDNSGSMADEQAALVASVPGFIDGIEHVLGAGVDYHVGVVSTDDNAFNANGCQEIGALVTRTSGRLSSEADCGPYADGGAYISKRDTLESAFGCAAQLGIDGSGLERQVDAMRAATRPSMDVMPCNAQFLRDDALLVVVLITDEDDHISQGQPIDWYEDILAAKQGDEARIVLLSLIGHHKPNDCIPSQWTGMQGAEIALRLITFTELFEHGIVADVCGEDFAPHFAQAIDGIAQACEVAAG